MHPRAPLLAACHATSDAAVAACNELGLWILGIFGALVLIGGAVGLAAGLSARFRARPGVVAARVLETGAYARLAGPRQFRPLVTYFRPDGSPLTARIEVPVPFEVPVGEIVQVQLDERNPGRVRMVLPPSRQPTQGAG